MDESLCDGANAPDEAIFRNDIRIGYSGPFTESGGPYREIFYLRVFGELSFSDIAAMFGKTES